MYETDSGTACAALQPLRPLHPLHPLRPLQCSARYLTNIFVNIVSRSFSLLCKIYYLESLQRLLCLYFVTTMYFDIRSLSRGPPCGLHAEGARARGREGRGSINETHDSNKLQPKVICIIHLNKTILYLHSLLVNTLWNVKWICDGEYLGSAEERPPRGGRLQPLHL